MNILWWKPWACFVFRNTFFSGRFGDRRNWDGYHWDFSSLDREMGWGWATYWVSIAALQFYQMGHCHYRTKSWSQKTNYRIFQFSLYLCNDNFQKTEINVFKIQGPVRCKVYWPQSCPIPRTGSCAGRKETALQCCWWWGRSWHLQVPWMWAFYKTQNNAPCILQVFAYDAEADVWTSRATLRTERCWHAVTAVNLTDLCLGQGETDED